MISNLFGSPFYLSFQQKSPAQIVPHNYSQHRQELFIISTKLQGYISYKLKSRLLHLADPIRTSKQLDIRNTVLKYSVLRIHLDIDVTNTDPDTFQDINPF